MQRTPRGRRTQGERSERKERMDSHYAIELRGGTEWIRDEEDVRDVAALNLDVEERET